MKYIPYSKLSGVPNIIVDGAAQADTVLTLSHWPASNSPPPFRADTGTEIVLNYLSIPTAGKQYAPGVRVVSNNHFDEDGLCAVWAMLYPKLALKQRDLLIDVATVGDFNTYRRPQAAKVVFTIRRHANPSISPIAVKLQEDDGTGSSRYSALLPMFARFLEEPESFELYWSQEWSAMLRSKTALVTGQVELREVPHVDLAVVQAPEALHPMVLYNHTERLRVLTALPGGHYCLRYRYETWVQFTSRPIMPRVDLTPLLSRLQDLERSGAQWTFDGIAVPTPTLQSLAPDGQPAPSSLSLETLLNELISFYQQEQNKPERLWNPYPPGRGISATT
ncbi:MAG: DUF6687 family protein [Anaerolineae bacterium]